MYFNWLYVEQGSQTVQKVSIRVHKHTSTEDVMPNAAGSPSRIAYFEYNFYSNFNFLKNHNSLSPTEHFAVNVFRD